MENFVGLISILHYLSDERIIVRTNFGSYGEVPSFCVLKRSAGCDQNHVLVLFSQRSRDAVAKSQ